MTNQRYRLVVEGPPNWTHFREFWKMFYEEGAVVVASTYTKVGGTYDLGFRHDPDRPLESLAEYALTCYTNRNLPQRVDQLARYVEEYSADGLLINSVKSCNSFSAGQLMIMREVEARTGKPGAFIETDLVDPRYFSAANVKNRLEIVPVKWIDRVLEVALERQPQPLPDEDQGVSATAVATAPASAAGGDVITH